MKSPKVKSIVNLSRDNELFDIRWRITNLCNYQCDFCIQGTRERHLQLARGESAGLRSATCSKIIGLIKRLEGFITVRVGFINDEVTVLNSFPK